ncbi:M28 family peptidase [Candidatus Binatia bacterium]|nr:M28 family peptidase [Candidatus Binatia bacterium]
MLRRTMAASYGLALGLALISLPDPARALDASDIAGGARRAPVGTREITATLASDELEGRNNLTEGSRKARAYLIGQLREIGPGVSGGTDDDAYEHPFALGTNLVAVIRGRELPDEYVMIGAHYDHLGVASNGDVYNGATDNAAGVAVAVSVARAIRSLPEAPRRSVAIALWDAEEDGLLGSIAYVGDPAIPIERTVAYVNLDIQGANLSPGLAGTSIAVGAETGGDALSDVVADAVRAELSASPRGVETLPISFIFGQLRSDYATFVAAGVPTVFFSDSTGSCYHTVRDETRFVDFDKLASQSRIAYRTTIALAEGADTPDFVAPNPALATYGDAITLDTIFTRARPDLKRFATPQRLALERVFDAVHAIVERGADAFRPDDVGTLLDAALQTLDVLDDGLACSSSFARRGGPVFVPGERTHDAGRPVESPHLPSRGTR